MGGYGSFDFAATYPQRVAAIAPLSGGENPDIAERIKTIPAWIFHGSDGPGVRTRVQHRHRGQDEGHRRDQGETHRLAAYRARKSDVTYSNPDLYAWFLQHSLP